MNINRTKDGHYMKQWSVLLLTLGVTLGAPVSVLANDLKPKAQEVKSDVIGTISNWKQDDRLKVDLPVTRFTLKNGLTVLLLEDHTVPMISYHTWYKVGSRDESEGVTGAAHMLEHMMFKGAKKYSGKQLDHLFHENGITNNAFTSNDYTGFYENIPSSKLELVMDIEVDRMKNLALQAEDLLSEKEVVAEERRWRIDNNPMGFLRESLMATVFRSHPYGWPVIGFMKDINAYDIEKLRYFYNTYYVPNNAVLVIVGDFDTKKTKKMVEKYYGTLTFKEVPHKNIKPEPVQTVQRNTVIRKDVQNTSFAIAFQSPKIGEADMYALDLAASILGDGSSSRIYKRLVYERQLATSAYAYNYSLQDGGIFSVGVNVIPGQTKDQALEISYNEIWKLRNKKVTDQELEKAKTQVIKNIVDGLRTIDGKARSLATNEIVTGSYQAIFTDLEKYQQVTADDILRVANKYLQQTQRSIISLEPKK